MRLALPRFGENREKLYLLFFKDFLFGVLFLNENIWDPPRESFISREQGNKSKNEGNREINVILRSMNIKN